MLNITVLLLFILNLIFASMDKNMSGVLGWLCAVITQLKYMYY